mmetsp:Transcript_162531/g.521016  ORF Transcript_162531/g.521016 Transcript_162531/m.521016 type:complete len:330 (-) Transcript_162531:213-1202(-)|eukprot:CAMPEP_0203963116 /NCGR_PEP_ID=MMETSP0359-20131031/93145_1 /ASSEMBLY_ACC=CAM_ASM_000338 /TAXON_ID=268821 /ORGANISM="Scrippsiella Hangoei, Strain SHTV-5" /LENGTH=329 /DNA_ID=CAMNT_0050898787 /DNA_START=67 /DNA_END=1056 /DNA_ORIENTATION=+
MTVGAPMQTQALFSPQPCNNDVSSTSNLLDQVTTVMFRNIPRKYTAMDVVAELETNVTREAFNFVYVPWFKSSTTNMGYAFVNTVDVTTARAVYAMMQGGRWKMGPGSRMMKMVPASMQGLEENLKQFHVNNAQHPNLEHCPLVFRKGIQVELNQALREFGLTPEAPFFPSSSCMQPPSDTPPPPRAMLAPAAFVPVEGEESAPLMNIGFVGFANVPDVLGESPFEHVRPAPGLELERLPLRRGHLALSVVDFSAQPKKVPFPVDPAKPRIMKSARFISNNSCHSCDSAKTGTSMSWVEEVLESPAYAAAWMQVDDLLQKLKQFGVVRA